MCSRVISDWEHVFSCTGAPAERRLAQVTCVGAKHLPDADMFVGGIDPYLWMKVVKSPAEQ